VASIPFIYDLYQKAKDKNIIAGIIIFDIISFLSFLINPICFFHPGDIDLFFGAIVGILFALKARKSFQHPVKLGFLVGILGAILSAISISFYEFFAFLLQNYEINFILFILIINFVFAGIIGSIIGGLVGIYYWRQDKKDNGLKWDLIN
jgi:predicted membrane protein